jgi:cytochrome P450 family 6
MEPDVREFFRALVKDMMEKRKQSKITRKDFLQLLIELKEKGSISMDAEEEVDKNAEIQSALRNTGTYSKYYLLKLLRPDTRKINFFLEFSDDDLVAQATVFFSAGIETSSSTISYTLLELAANPDVQRKAQLEIDEALSQSNGEITFESLKNMKYLDWVLQGIHQNEFKMH